MILTQEQPLLTRIIVHLKEKKMETQYNVLGYRIHLYFHYYKPAIETDENGHSDRNIDYEIKRKKPIEQEIGCKFIRINPGKEDFDIFRAIIEVFRHIEESTKKTLLKKFQRDY